MFAIFRYKPSPFCLLDEIDAPLDDANVSRFVDMLRGMLDRTQFILITHNRRTMEIANRLYGVTMDEPGVSKLISGESETEPDARTQRRPGAHDGGALGPVGGEHRPDGRV
jgi:chromosome segregation protein